MITTDGAVKNLVRIAEAVGPREKRFCATGRSGDLLSLVIKAKRVNYPFARGRVVRVPAFTA